MDYENIQTGEIENRTDFHRLLKYGWNGLELGTAKGHFANQLMFNQDNNGYLVCVDSWADDGRNHNAKEYMHTVNFLSMHHNVEVWRMTFDEFYAVQTIPKYDFIFMDGYAHLGNNGSKNLMRWFEKVADGGIFAIHDYHTAWPENVASCDMFFRTIQRTPDGLTRGDEFPSIWIRK